MNTRKKDNTKKDETNCEKSLKYLNNLRKANCTNIAYNDFTKPSSYPAPFFFYPYNKEICLQASRQYIELLNECNKDEHAKFKVGQ